MYGLGQNNTECGTGEIQIWNHGTGCRFYMVQCLICVQFEALNPRTLHPLLVLLTQSHHSDIRLTPMMDNQGGSAVRLQHPRLPPDPILACFQKRWTMTLDYGTRASL
jgi:hypothetical protein